MVTIDDFTEFLYAHNAKTEYEDVLTFWRGVNMQEEWDACEDKAELLSDGLICWVNGLSNVGWEEFWGTEK